MNKVEMTKLSVPEVGRTYNFPDGSCITIPGVTHIAVRPSGNHRLTTQDGNLHIVKDGWIHIEIVGGPEHWQL